MYSVGSLESTQEAKIKLFYPRLRLEKLLRLAFLVLSKLPACIHNWLDIRTLSMDQFFIKCSQSDQWTEKKDLYEIMKDIAAQLM